MRGAFSDQCGLFSYISAEARVPKAHPLRAIRALVREVLSELNRSFSRLYASEGPRRRRLHAQPDRLQPDPRPQADRCIEKRPARRPNALKAIEPIKDRTCRAPT